jgi:hypothetical protein
MSNDIVHSALAERRKEFNQILEDLNALYKEVNVSHCPTLFKAIMELERIADRDTKKIKEALEWIDFVLENPDQLRALRNARDLLRNAL